MFQETERKVGSNYCSVCVYDHPCLYHSLFGDTDSKVFKLYCNFNSILLHVKGLENVMHLTFTHASLIVRYARNHGRS